LTEIEKVDEIKFYGWQEFCRFMYNLDAGKEAFQRLFKLASDKLFDIGIGSYYLSTSQKDYSFKTLAFSNTDFVFPDDTVDSKAYVSKCIDALFVIAGKLEEKYSDLPSSILQFVREVDFPLALTTAHMNNKGILVDQKSLENKQNQLQDEIKRVEKKVFDLVGHEFNIASSRQLSDILFNELELPTGKKTKTGYSTGEGVLQSLVGAHPVIEHIFDYREITKLKSTYIDPLLEYAENSEEGRIHSKFNQLGTTTGRLSSSDPNLQNIPTRSSLGKEIKAMFVAPKGRKLVSADYSQIELRIMAHISKDRNMLDDFENGRDFHSATAVRLLGLDKDDISKDQRRIAKTINFGVLYGMSPYGLSRSLNIEVEKAKEYIDAYFEKYCGVKDYMDETLDLARKEGYVETMWGRKRYVKGVKSGNWRIRSASEREAINMPIQGTAADIMRKAMVDVYKWLLKEQDINLLLQIHDELVLECDDRDVDRVGKKLKEIMCGVVNLKIPLDVEVTSGDNLRQ
jgi:DNA polymerase-1